MEAPKKKHSATTVMEEEHHSLKTIIYILQNKLDSLEPENLTRHLREEFLFLFQYFYRRLKFHFNIEESIGVLKDIRDKEIHFADEVKLIERDHSDLLAVAKEFTQRLKGHMEDVKGKIKGLDTDFNHFIDSLAIHEERETGLILKVANTDYGSKD